MNQVQQLYRQLIKIRKNKKKMMQSTSQRQLKPYEYQTCENTNRSNYNEDSQRTSINKLLEVRARALQQQCSKIKEYRRMLEDRKIFWKNREEQFRVQCYKVKKYGSTSTNYQSYGDSKQDRLISVLQNTSRAIDKAQQFLKTMETTTLRLKQY